jgi:hypothetical protein
VAQGARSELAPANPSGPGEDGLYCVTDEVGATVFGGVLGWALDGDVLHLSLEPDAAVTLGLEPTVSFRLGVPQTDIDQISAGLHQVLTDGC